MVNWFLSAGASCWRQTNKQTNNPVQTATADILHYNGHALKVEKRAKGKQSARFLHKTILKADQRVALSNWQWATEGGTE